MVVVFDFKKKPLNWEIWHVEFNDEWNCYEYAVCDLDATWVSECFTVYMISRDEARFMYE